MQSEVAVGEEDGFNKLLRQANKTAGRTKADFNRNGIAICREQRIVKPNVKEDYIYFVKVQQPDRDRPRLTKQ